jgi:hypothetical protein
MNRGIFEVYKQLIDFFIALAPLGTIKKFPVLQHEICKDRLKS